MSERAVVRRSGGAELSAILAIAHRDFVKLLRDRLRLISELSFPLILILLLGPALQSGFGSPGGLDLTTFVFTGVIAQTIWQSAALGLISLIADREEDFSQEIFVSPISRYSIVAGKIIGESLVALPTGVGIIVVGLLIGVPMSAATLLAMLPLAFGIAVYGGAFGLLILSNISSQRTANQIFPFVMLPQFFLAGVFNPIHDLPPPLAILSAISPMRYAVEATRNVFYGLQPDIPAPAMSPADLDFSVIVLSFLAFIFVGTLLFVRAERNR
jgi:ABC-2 type transport system permease protein